MAVSLAVDSMVDLRDLLIPVMRAIALTIGPRCEVVLHDIQAHDYLASSIIAIENGHVTGRHVGGPSTNLGLEALRDATANPDRFSYRSHTPDGRELHCSSIYFRNGHGDLIGALCINLDVQPYVHARDTLDELIGRDAPAASDPEEVFGTEIGDVLDGMVQLAVSRVGIPVSAMSRDDKVAVIRLLDKKGAFLVKRAIDRIARVLRVSRVTAYNYLEEARAWPGDGANGHMDSL